MDNDEILKMTESIIFRIKSRNINDMNLALVYIESFIENQKILENLKNNFEVSKLNFPPHMKEQKAIYEKIIEILNT